MSEIVRDYFIFYAPFLPIPSVLRIRTISSIVFRLSSSMSKMGFIVRPRKLLQFFSGLDSNPTSLISGEGFGITNVRVLSFFEANGLFLLFFELSIS